MALQNILELIASEAQSEAKRIQENAELHAKEVREKCVADAEAKIQVVVSEKDAYIASLKKRHETRMRMEQRAVLSQKKSQVLDRVFDAAKEYLQKASDAELEKIFSALLSQISSSHGNVVLLGEGQKNAFEKALKATGKNFSVVEQKDLRGGFLFRSENFEMDFSFSNLLEKVLRPQVEGKLSALLFGKE